MRSYKDNLPILAQVFLQQAAQKHARKVSLISPDAMELLCRWDYPGNMRELKNSLEHAVVMARGDTVQADDLPKVMHGNAAPVTSPAVEVKTRTLAELREAWVNPLEKKYLLELLDAHGGRVDPAAKVAGINRVTMYRLMEKHGITLEKKPRS